MKRVENHKKASIVEGRIMFGTNLGESNTDRR